jgi:hypothetical protein
MKPLSQLRLSNNNIVLSKSRVIPPHRNLSVPFFFKKASENEVVSIFFSKMRIKKLFTILKAYCCYVAWAGAMAGGGKV